ncbi:M48 family metalloprotease [Nonomuraea sp. NPDC050783]|uniref:M48 family metalloprotease n=1 Tax=Nonomuraea sp. NPDC050783 TaxID=3154634 RepID=UPI003466ABDE
MTRQAAHGLVPRMVAAAAMLVLVYAVAAGALSLAGVPWPVVAAGVVPAAAAQWWTAEWLARATTRARIVTPDQEPGLHAVLDRLCALDGLPKPRVAVTPDPVPNAFTLGRSKRHTTVVVTRGLLEALEPDELGVALAHEIAHIRHRDVAVMTLAGSPAVALSWGARVAHGFVRRNSRPAPLLHQLRDLPLALVLPVLYPLIAGLGLVALLAQLPLRALGRHRELAADHDAAVRTGQPALLAATLLKIGARDAIPATDLRAARVPATALVPTRRARFAWWSTHPAVARRVDRLTRGAPPA